MGGYSYLGGGFFVSLEKLSQRKKMGILVLVDIAMLLLAVLLTIFVVFSVYGSNIHEPMVYLLVIGAIQILSNVFCGVYRISLHDSSVEVCTHLMGSAMVVFFGFMLVGITHEFTLALVRLFIVYAVLSYGLQCAYRVGYRLIYILVKGKEIIQIPALVYGAGDIGKTIVRQSQVGKTPYHIVGFIDDDEAKTGTLVLGVRVLGSVDDFLSIIAKSKAKTLIIAITQLSSERMNQMLGLCSQNGITLKIVPSLFEMENKGSQVFDLRNVNYEDLLGRQLIDIDHKPIAEMISGKVVMVTGACGSIGSEICRQVKSYGPKQLILVDIDESGLHDASLRLLHYAHEWSDSVVPVLCDIKNKVKIDAIFDKYHPELVFHAAAYKHVPLIQLYPEEGIRTNIMGSFNVLSAAKRVKTRKVIVISTDKAVNPTNVMGATKRVVELEASMLTCPETEITCVRFGNVLGSRGSMLPLFMEEINAGVPITVTDKRIIRYFMAIPEAVSLVFLAGSMGRGGEVMVLDMGQPVNIYSFAERLIALYGNPERNKIIITGLRPGEKMYEELLANKDNTIRTENKLIFKAKLTQNSVAPELFARYMDTINSDSPEVLVEHLHDVVPEFSR